MAQETLIILNPQARGGRAETLWEQIEPVAEAQLGALRVAVTRDAQAIQGHLDAARQDGIRRVIAVGGDGTCHSIVNALADSQMPMSFGQIPMGTGQDFARFLGIPDAPEEAIAWLVDTPTRPLDLGYLDYQEAGKDTHCYFLNIASVGIGGKVSERVNHVKKRRPWTFWLATVQTFLTYHPLPLRVRLDGEDWYEGKSWLVAIANGAIFGRGMKIAPHASVNDGLFDVVLVRDCSRLRALTAMNTVYSGRHLELPEVMYRRAARVEIETDGAIPIDLDGEHTFGANLHFTVRPGALDALYR